MRAIHGDLRASSNDDRGIGIVEIVISMFLLALLATAFLPLLIQGLKQSAANATLATATQLANDQIEQVRSKTTCAALSSANQTVTDAQGVSLLVSRTVGPCTVPADAENPTKVSVSVTVTRSDTGVVMASADTIVFISVPW